MKRSSLVTLILLVCVGSSFGQTRADDTTANAINNVLCSFMNSIIKKDTATLSSLFANNVPIGWIDVQSKGTLNVVKKSNPATTMVESDTHTNFIKYIGRTKNTVEEKFYNIKIRHDGLIASVSFDYSFWGNGKKENWGQENWEMVYNGAEWKIAGVYFSYTLESVTNEPDRIKRSK